MHCLGVGKVPGSKLLAISTYNDDPNNAFTRRMADDRPDHFDVRIKYVADKFDDRARELSWPNINKANPGLARKPSLRAQLAKERQVALQDERALWRFRSLRLNHGSPVSQPHQLVLQLADWKDVECDPTVEMQAGPLVLGLDPSAGRSMYAAAAYWPQTGYLRVLGGFGAEPCLRDRERTAGLSEGSYSGMETEGTLVVCPGKVVSAHLFIAEAISRFGWPEVVVCDSYRSLEAKQVLIDMGFDLAFVERRTGWKSASEDLQVFRRLALTKALHAERTLMLSHAIMCARTVSDSTGNEKLGGRAEATAGRFDALAASIIAVAEGDRRWQEAQARPRLEPMFSEPVVIRRRH